MDQQLYSTTCFSSSSKIIINGKEKKKNKGLPSSARKVMKLSTDPQSVAARERRHRISDRLKILQSLVPGGSKMDTVTMLEEAIHYVKFLKTQIWLHQTMINLVDHINHNPNHLVDHQNTQMNMQVPNYDDAFQQVGFPFSDGDQFQGEETNFSADAFMYY
ncbi:hypothetical protein HAX54_044509 [Datura stramonium]|uniref:BHLH domain-containing protein n=1 Tax=Datura stramonium TaxID=4076 RepID=A0ABS8WGN3_DATST|nr:hypothetical protein [Datura stramonium]